MTPDPADILLVFTSTPDEASAHLLARALVERRVAACVSVLSPGRSVYRWQGAVEAAQEWPVLIKTHREAYPALETALRETHPYDVPEILAVPVAAGLSDYLAWVGAETARG